MASLSRSALLPQCSSCIRRVARLSLDAAHQTRSISKAAKDAERLIIVRLLKDVPRYGRAGSLVPLNRATMRNRWFPARVADYVPFLQLKALKAQDVDMQRDPTFGVEVALEEANDAELDLAPRRPYVRPIEIEMLSPERSMELIDTFIPASIDFTRQRIEQGVDAGPRPVATGAAAVLTAAAMGSKPKANPNAIYGSVTTADVVATLKAGLAHNDEAARVILNEADVRFVTGSEDADAQRVKELGVFRVEIQVPGAEAPLVRNVRVKAKDMDA
ncbi:hypothetical protein C7974DRAFT_401513 [Boeremia exigua]|uniref:uncharacterized protein n=1 Tax=Boeremia exigua TaxID=749465 RepID=UPI001E8DE0F2|nr:uncharacterized protein C7974DRAFT_401513 [Boeremia exigua]KAH6616275.1 hypothetical protein C7974DRAFT_401513 [Boeremia exigua]